MDSHNRDRDDNWKPCPRGELQRMIERLGQERGVARRTALSRLAAGMLILFAVGAAVIWSLQVPAVAGGLTCAECQDRFDALYRQVDLGEITLPQQILTKVLAHLEHCEFCRSKFRQLYPNSSVIAGLDAEAAECLPGQTVDTCCPEAAFTLAATATFTISETMGHVHSTPHLH